EQSPAAVCGHGNSGFAIAMIALVSLGLTFAAQAQSKTAPVAAPDAKPATRNQDAQLYRNPTFAFRYKIPYGWVYRTKEMQAGNEAGKGEVLLAVFERPPEATGDTINSAVVIASESAASHPGLKKAEDYSARSPNWRPPKVSRPMANRTRWWLKGGNCCAPISSSRGATNSPCASARSSCSRRVRSFRSPSSPAAKTNSTT